MLGHGNYPPPSAVTKSTCFDKLPRYVVKEDVNLEIGGIAGSLTPPVVTKVTTLHLDDVRKDGVPITRSGDYERFVCIVVRLWKVPPLIHYEQWLH